MYGWRIRVGLAVPSVNTVMESELSTNAPEGVSVATGRMGSFGDLTIENLSVINEDLEQSATLLAPADVDVIVYGLGMTPASVVDGESHDVTVRERIESTADVTGIASSGSLRRAFDALGVDRIAALTPYTDNINAHLREHAADGWGYPIVATAGWRITEGVNIGNPTPGQTYRQARAVDHPDADAVVVGGTNQRSFEMIDTLERDLGKPVVTANQATLWDVLQQTGVDYSDIELGRLFKQ
jgi:maleate isomerase